MNLCAKGCGRKAVRRGLCSSHYNTRRERDIAYGRWQPIWVDAEPVRRHVRALQAAGMGTRTIAEKAGVCRSVIQALINGRKIYDNTPSKQISADNANKLLAIQPDARPASGALIDDTATRRRLQALVAIGYTKTYLCGLIGVTPQNGNSLFNGGQTGVRQSTADTVAAIYDDLSMTPGPSQRARTLAKKKRWASPLAWDDDSIGDPEAKPDRGEKRHADWGERFLELRDLGYSDFDIAGKLKIRPESMLRQMERYGIPVQTDFNTFALDKRYRSTAS